MDSLSYLYVEHCKIEQDKLAIAIFDKKGKVPIPCANLAMLMIGPGTSITHSAIKNLADNGCLVIWSGEHGIRFYSQGMGKTRSAKNILIQAKFASYQKLHLLVVKRMYTMRFKEKLEPNITLQQIRGKEGIRVKLAYRKASKETGVEWHGRSYRRGEWAQSDTINRALSAGNACLYGLCHSAIISAGYSTAIGFIHTGQQLSFVFDIADLYKVELIIPLAFRLVKESTENIDRRIRIECRNLFRDSKLIKRIIPDIHSLFTIDPNNKDFPPSILNEEDIDYDIEKSKPGKLWDPESNDLSSGKNYG